MSNWRWFVESRFTRPRTFTRIAVRYYALRALCHVVMAIGNVVLFGSPLMTEDDDRALGRVGFSFFDWVAPRLERAHGDMISALNMWNARRSG